MITIKDHMANRQMSWFIEWIPREANDVAYSAMVFSFSNNVNLFVDELRILNLPQVFLESLALDQTSFNI